MKINHEIQCSRCGKREKVSLDPDAQNSIMKAAHKWSATGVPYCPECTKVITNKTTDYEAVLKVLLRAAVMW